MTEYLVEVYVPGSGPELSRAVVRARSAADDVSQAQTSVRYLRSIFVPEDETCFHFYEAVSAAAVEEASRRAEIAFDRVVRAQQVAVGELDGPLLGNEGRS